jgi:hypothetical protein
MNKRLLKTRRFFIGALFIMYILFTIFMPAGEKNSRARHKNMKIQKIPLHT